MNELHLQCCSGDGQLPEECDARQPLHGRLRRQRPRARRLQVDASVCLRSSVSHTSMGPAAKPKLAQRDDAATTWRSDEVSSIPGKQMPMAATPGRC